MMVRTERLPAGAEINAIKRNDIQVDLFAVGARGVVYTNYVLANPDGSWGGWHAWTPLRDSSSTFPDHFTVPPDASIAALKRNDHQEDIFVAGRDGIAYTNFVIDGNAWNPQWISLGSPPERFPAGAEITAIKRNDIQVDLFAVAPEESYTPTTSWPTLTAVGEAGTLGPRSDAPPDIEHYAGHHPARF